jgi:transposase
MLRLHRKKRREFRRDNEWMKHQHYAAARELLQKFLLLIIPILAVADLSSRKKRGGRSIGRSGTRLMNAWSHGMFRERVLWASRRVEYPRRHVLFPGEPGTTKTCTFCGHWNGHIQLGDKHLKCAACGGEIDRQDAGARNNFLAAYGMAVGVHWDRIDDRRPSGRGRT